MKRLKLYLFLVVISFVSFVCYADYHPTGEYGGFPHGGYTDSRTSGNTVIVNYDGGVFDSQKKVENYLLYRCAKVTQENGYDFFIVVSITTSPEVVHVQTRTNHHNYMTDPPRLFTAYPDSTEYASSTSSSTSMRCRYNPGAPCHPEIHGVSAVIKMFKGPTPKGVRRAYGAADVIAHLQPDTF